MRRMIGNKIVARGIALAMAAMLAVTPLSAVAVNDHGMNEKFGKDAPVSTEAYDNKKIENGLDNGLEEAVDSAKEAATTAKDSAKEVTEKVGEASEEIENMKEAAKDAEPVSGEIKDAAGKADTTATKTATKADTLEEDAKAYNEDAEKLNAIGTDKVKADAEHIAEIAKDAQDAKKALDEALKIAVDENLTHSYEEAKETLKDVIKNATDTEKKFTKVKEEYEAAEENMAAIIEEYNRYAEKLGLAKYVQLEDGSYELGKAPEKSQVEKLSETKQDVLDTKLDDISETVKKFNDLTDAYDKAAEKEKAAEEKLDAAKEKYGKDYEAVENAVNKANNYFVDKANANQVAKQEAVNAKNAVLAEKNQKVEEATKVANAKNAALKQEEKAAQSRAEAVYDAIIDGIDAEIEALEKKLNWGNGFWIGPQIAALEAKKGEEWLKKNSTIKKAYNNDELLKKAQNEANQAQGALNTAKSEQANASQALQKANAELDSAKKTLEEKTTLRDAFLAAFEAAYNENNDNGSAYKEQKDGEVATDKEDIKQVSFDKAVNKWANEIDEYAKDYFKKLIRFKFKDAEELRKFANDMREYMLDTYTKEAKWKEFLDKNTSFLQAFADTKEFDKATTDLLAAIMKELNQDATDAKLAEANISKNDMKAIDKAVKDKVAEFTDAKATISSLDKKIKNSKEVVKDAQETYNTAKATLEKAREKAGALELTKTEEAALQAKIAEAQQDLKAAKEALQTAKENVEKMQIAKEWAEHLSNGLEKMSVSVQQKMDNHGKNLGINATANEAHYNEEEFEAGTKETIDKNPAKFIRLVEYKEAKQGNVPFEIFQKFVKLSYVDNEKPMKYKDSWYYINIDKDLKHSPVLYWVLDKDGKFTGKFIKDEAELVDGQTYYVAYAFKKVQAQYHLDGYMFTYVKPINEDVKPINEDVKPVENNDNNTNTDINTNTNTTIEEQETPLDEEPEIKEEDTKVEDTNVESSEIEEEDVAKSDAPEVASKEKKTSKATQDTTDIEDEKAPLSDNPMTGDSLPIAWAGLGLLGLVGITGVVLSNKKKEN